MLQDAMAGNVGSSKLPPKMKDKLAKLLGMLGSNHVGERNNAATQIEKLRKELDLSWDDII
jgi:hypothetical protein